MPNLSAHWGVCPLPTSQKKDRPIKIPNRQHGMGDSPGAGGGTLVGYAVRTMHGHPRPRVPVSLQGDGTRGANVAKPKMFVVQPREMTLITHPAPTAFWGEATPKWDAEEHLQYLPGALPTLAMGKQTH